MKSKLIMVAVVATTALLAGCSTNMELANKVDMLTNQVNDLSIKVDGLASEQQMIKVNANESADMTAKSVQTAVSEAERANVRIDNIVESYKK